MNIKQCGFGFLRVWKFHDEAFWSEKHSSAQQAWPLGIGEQARFYEFHRAQGRSIEWRNLNWF